MQGGSHRAIDPYRALSEEEVSDDREEEGSKDEENYQLFAWLKNFCSYGRGRSKKRRNATSSSFLQKADQNLNEKTTNDYEEVPFVENDDGICSWFGKLCFGGCFRRDSHRAKTNPTWKPSWKRTNGVEMTHKPMNLLTMDDEARDNAFVQIAGRTEAGSIFKLGSSSHRTIDPYSKLSEEEVSDDREGEVSDDREKEVSEENYQLFAWLKNCCFYGDGLSKKPRNAQLKSNGIKVFELDSNLGIVKRIKWNKCLTSTFAQMREQAQVAELQAQVVDQSD